MNSVKRSETERRVLPVEGGQGRRVKPGEPGDFVEELARRRRQAEQDQSQGWTPKSTEPEEESQPEDRVEIQGLKPDAPKWADGAIGPDPGLPGPGRHLDVKG